MKQNYSGALNKTPGWEEGSFYKIVRFKTGEVLLCETETNIQTIATEIYLEMIRPVVRVVTGQNKSEMENLILDENYTLIPWISNSSSSSFTIPIEMVLTIGDMNERMVTQYKSFWTIMDVRDRIIKEEVDQDIIDTEIISLLLSVSKTGKVKFLSDEHTTLVSESAVPDIQAPKELPLILMETTQMELDEETTDEENDE